MKKRGMLNEIELKKSWKERRKEREMNKHKY